jgi:uncharacterized membrane protein
MELEDLVVLVMRAGLVISVDLLIGGVLMTLLGPTGMADVHSPVNSSAYPLSRLLHTLPSAPSAVAVMFMGLAALLATPLLRVALAVLEFAKEGNWIYLRLSFLVLLILLMSLFLPSIRG